VTSPHPLHGSILVAVAVGGAVGACARHALLVAFPDRSSGFPWTVFAVNVTGCLLLALLPAVAVVRRRPLLPPLLGTGMLGGFTTMSTYAEQSRSLLAAGQADVAATYVVGTFLACLLAVAVGHRFSDAAHRAQLHAEEGDL
jgi:CrcB protein